MLDEALEHYFKALNIIERVKGHESIHCVDLLNDIGLVYRDQNKLK